MADIRFRSASAAARPNRGVHRLLDHLRETLDKEPDAPLAALLPREAFEAIPLPEVRAPRKRTLSSYLDPKTAST